MNKQYLLTPGPVAVPERVQRAVLQPMIHHRLSPEFAGILDEVVQGLQWGFQTSHPVHVLTGSGTMGMEAAVCNFASRGDKVICIGGASSAIAGLRSVAPSASRRSSSMWSGGRRSIRRR
jgi:aspartate aminotransferase-like enzyme